MPGISISPSEIITITSLAASTIIMTENAYMTDEVWEELAPILAAGVRECDPVVKRHPLWWYFMSWDGLGSHSKSLDAITAFSNARGKVGQESGNLSQACLPDWLTATYLQSMHPSTRAPTIHVSNYKQAVQAYDQIIAKEDKVGVDRVKKQLQPFVGVPDQWDLALAVCTAIGGDNSKAWTASFKRVNFCEPRLTFQEWINTPRIAEMIIASHRSFLPSLCGVIYLWLVVPSLWFVVMYMWRRHCP